MASAAVRSMLGVGLGLTVAGLGIVVAAPASAQGQAQAQSGRLDARYSVTLGGVPIGKGAWVIDITDTQYTAAASGATSGLLRVLSTGQGQGASRGYIVGGNPVPASFAASVTTDKKTEEIRMTLASGDVKQFSIVPEVPPDDDRIPVTEAHKRGVSDPMTGSLVRVPGTGNPVGPQACQRTNQIFDGRMRYNLQFAYKRMEQVKAEKGYEGPAVVCSVTFVPLAGYVPHRAAIKYLVAQRDIEIWLAPIAATRVLVPFRVSIPTPIGTGVMQATQFVSMPPPPHAAAVGSRTQ
ncbi:DUF3108 domain-containing protein [Rhodoplanes sp. Z2-YC6860]|uniref:DUF3108 domain-containing protein n=1 Tax=Rhodoplanes sp. Z2-YC6860 TaxID=674703 RepID=UPI000AC76CB3|nr:DUF3108 domain-containing protein [Rhodoplanes sp. Z2-YC6860]